MAQEEPFEPTSQDSLERNSDVPEPTQSERRLRSSVRAGSSERPSRPSVRPSAFGLPRPSTRPSLAPESPRTSRRPPDASASDRDDEDERDADTSPGLVFTAASPSASLRASTPPRGRSIPSPRSSAPAPIPVASPPLQLVLAKTSLPDAPAHMAMPMPAAPAAPADTRRTGTSIAIFAVMLCAAAVPFARYALKRAPEPATDRALAQPAQATAAPAPKVVAAKPSPAAQVAVQPAKVDRLPEIMAGLPPEAGQASEYLVDHAIRARDSGELPLAETLLGRASELDDRNPHPAFALAQLRFAQGNYEGAEGWIANAIRLRPRRAEYRKLYAEILTRLGRDHEARDEQRKAQRLQD